MSSNGYIRGKPDVTWWLQQINAGIAFRKKYAYQSKWDAWRNYYRGNWRPGILPSNLFFKMLRTTVPRIYFRNPSISVQPAKPGMVNWAFAQLLERIDNKMIRQMKVKQRLKMAVQDAFLFGTGVPKLGFGAEFTPTPNTLGQGTIDPLTRKGERVEYNSFVQPNMPWCNRTMTGNFIVPAGTNDFDEARWVAEWFKRPIADVRDDTRLKNVKNLVSTSKTTVNHDNAMMFTPDITRSLEMIDLVEIRDKKTGQVMVIAPFQSDRELLFEDDAMQVSGRFNYYPINFNPDDEVFWGVPDSQILEPQQLELNEIRTQMMRHRRIALARVLAKKGVLTPEEQARWVSEDVNPVIEINGEPMTDVRTMEAGGIPPDLPLAEAIVMQDVRESMGFSRNEFGEAGPANARTSAFEVQVVREASEIRVDERRDSVADALVDLVKDMHIIIFSEWTQEQVIDVIGPAGVPLWIKFRPEMLRSGSYEVKIDPDTSLPETKELRSNRALALYERLKTNPIIDPMRLTRYLMHELHGVQFDDMIRGLPSGGPEQPLNIEQFTQLNQRVASQAPQALIADQRQAA